MAGTAEDGIRPGAEKPKGVHVSATWIPGEPVQINYSKGDVPRSIFLLRLMEKHILEQETSPDRGRDEPERIVRLPPGARLVE